MPRFFLEFAQWRCWAVVVILSLVASFGPAGRLTAQVEPVGPELASPSGDEGARVARREAEAADLTTVLDAPADRESDVGREEAVEVPVESREVRARRARIRECLDTYYRRPIPAAGFSPWSVMHALLPWGVDAHIDANGRQVNAIGWLCWNQPCRGQRLLYLSRGRVQAQVGVGVQGHEGQFLAILAQSRVPATYGIKVGGKDFTVRDLIQSEMATCRAGTELTFKLIGLSHYLDSDTKWTNDLGEDWDIPRLIREELAQPINGVACGGTHRMSGFGYAVRKREQRGEPITGEWARAKKYVQDYHEYTFALQNPNGSFSTNWFRGRGDSGDIDRYLQTTGHMLEFLLLTMSDEELTDPRLVKSVDFLTALMLRHQNREWEVGPLGHALHALVIYDERVFGTKPGHRTAEIARRSNR